MYIVKCRQVVNIVVVGQCAIVLFLLCPLLSGARPKDEEREVYAEVEAVLESAKKILAELRAYEGASDDIRQVCLAVLLVAVQAVYSVLRAIFFRDYLQSVTLVKLAEVHLFVNMLSSE